MGIKNLLPFLKDATTNVDISKNHEGLTVAVDTYCWIYRGAFSCAEQLALGQYADGHIKYVLRYVNKLLEWGIKPIMIFDGCNLPSKKGTEQKRSESKQLYRKKAAQCLAEGRVNEARECFQKCIDCTPKMALEVIKALQELGVDVIVAPYEADAQLTYLNKIKVAQMVITEDSDMIPFGCDKVKIESNLKKFFFF
jgi:exonuclease 1